MSVAFSTMVKWARPAAILAVAAAMVGGMGGLAGCASNPRSGYAFATTYDTDISTIHVSGFGNETFHHDLEFLLTDAIVKEIQSSTPWRITSAEYAQTTLSGTIVGAEMTRLSTGRTSGLVQELAVVLTIDYEWKDARTGQVLIERHSFTAAEPFAPALGVGDRIEVGQNAAIAELARDVVESLRSNW